MHSSGVIAHCAPAWAATATPRSTKRRLCSMSPVTGAMCNRAMRTLSSLPDAESTRIIASASDGFPVRLKHPLDARFGGKHNGYKTVSLPRGVVVARQPLELESLVRAQAGQPSTVWPKDVTISSSYQSGRSRLSRLPLIPSPRDQSGKMIPVKPWETQNAGKGLGRLWTQPSEGQMAQ